MNLATTTSNAVESLTAICILALIHLFVKELGRVEISTRYALLCFPLAQELRSQLQA